MADTQDGSLTHAHGELLNLLIDTPDLNTFLDRVVALATHVVTPAVACGMTMHRDGQPVTVANSAALAAQVDEIQYGADEGPCLETLDTGHIIQVDDLAADERWPRYRDHAVEQGVVSSLSMPIVVEQHTVAALNLYSPERHGFTGLDRAHAEAFAGQCAAALTLLLRQADDSRVREQLGAAMASRSIIDQAIGILMGQQRCGAAQAFNLLRQASQHRNRKLRDVAADIITNVSGEPPQPPAHFRIGTDG